MQKNALDLVYNSDRIEKINHLVGEGIAYHQMPNLAETIHQQLLRLLSPQNEPDLPEDFSYIGYDILNPEEEYIARGNGKIKQSGGGSKKSDGFQLLPTDSRFVRYNFRNGQETFSRNVQIPFIRRGGITQINGTKYTISPVIKTRGVSNTAKGFFVSFDSNPVNFERQTRTFLANGSAKHYYLPVTNDMHRHDKKGSGKFQPPLAGWLLAKYGVTELFKRFLSVDVKVHNDNDPILRELDTQKYLICRAIPPANKKEKYTDFALVIERDKCCLTAQILIGTMFYISSFYGDRMDYRYLDDVDTWRLLLGYACHGENQYQDSMHLLMIERHLESVEKYLDPIFAQQLLHEGMEFNDIYEFFFYIVELYTVGDNNGSLANVWGRYLTCTEYVLVDLRHNIRRCMWDLKAAAKDTTTGKSGGKVSRRRVESIINFKISANALLRIATGHGEVAPLQVTTDNMLIGVTSRAIDETDAKKSPGSSKKTVDLTDLTKHLHVSFIEVGSVANLPKSAPYGLAVLSPYLQIDQYGKIMRKRKNRDVLDRAHENLRQKGF